MAGPFVSEEMFDVVVKYAEVKLKSGLTAIVVINTTELEQRYKGSVKEIHTMWVLPNWKQSNEVMRKAIRWDPEAGERSLDWATYRSILMETFMRGWDIKGDKDQSIPCIKENMDKLDPNVAAALVQGFLARTNVTEKDLGN